MTHTSRPYNDERDHVNVLEFLRDTYAETGSLENWLPPRFENNSRDMDPHIHVWGEAGHMVGLAIPEKPQVYFVQLHPRHMSLYPEIVTWIEGHSKANKKEGAAKLSIIELEGNPAKEEVLRVNGFTRGRVYGIFRTRKVDAPIPGYTLPPGFTVRSVTPEDFGEIACCIRQVFGHGEWFTHENLEELAATSIYQPDLDLAVVDAEGKIVSFCTFRLDSPSRVTELEPMGTLEEYRSKGIGRALLCEGFRRLKRYNPSLLYIGGAANTPAANRLYEVTGFTERVDYYCWDKPI